MHSTLHSSIASTENNSTANNNLNTTSTNATQLLRSYQVIIRGMILKYQTLPIESYIHELAAYTHIFVLCKNRQSHIAERVFSNSLLADLVSEVIYFDQQYNLLVQVYHTCRRSELFPFFKQELNVHYL
ncbi:hypothetical protein CU097_002458 [Rhizopus azygosporus]|uniref:Uncharacterized protein n=1 Tax=Rhizopus azygosporus TaxID=86630 RepID=A0A367J4R0_RHIAZ|nr:hypothetical protein CU097_002458 [Rhizopus azygosporus]